MEGHAGHTPSVSDRWMPTAGSDDVAFGQLYRGLPLPDLDDFRLYFHEPEALVMIPALLQHALVVAAFGGFATVAPVVWSAHAGDPQEFERVVERARTAAQMVILPELIGVWQGRAVAFLFQLTTLPLQAFRDPPAEALAMLAPMSRGSLQRRVTRSAMVLFGR
jgi:hypothetical protein